MINIDLTTIFIFLLALILVCILIKKGLFGSKLISGGFSSILGGEDANGFFYSKGKDLKSLNVNGSAIVKDGNIGGKIDVKGALEIKGCTVEGKTDVTGTLDSANTTFKDIKLYGTGNIFKGSAGKITVCGKFKAKGSTIDEIVLEDGCDLTGVNPPYIRLIGTEVKKIKIPKSMNEAEVVEKK